MYTVKRWKRFSGKPNSYIRSTDMRVTMGPRGDIYLNKIAWERMGEPDAVELLFDEGRGVIGLEVAEAWEEDSFPVRHKKKASGKVIHANPFCVTYDLKPARTVVFNEAHIDEKGVLELPLATMTVSARGMK